MKKTKSIETKNLPDKSFITSNLDYHGVMIYTVQS